MSICIDKLNENISSPCTNPLFAGKRRKGWLFNRADISSYTTDPLNDHIVDNITLASGAKGYFIQADVKLPFNASVSAMNEGDYTNDFTHNVVCYIPNDGADWRENIVNKIANGEFVVVLENKWTGNNGDNQFQIFGLQQGLLAVSDVNEDAENGGWNFTLQENGTPMSGMYYWHTDEETSRNDLDALAGGGGGGLRAAKDVNFYDYDGTLLYSYTKAEALALTALPALPNHTAEGLTAVEWNWTLADIADCYTHSGGIVNIGAVMTPTDGKTHIIAEPPQPQWVSLRLQASMAGAVSVDWGDGSPVDIWNTTSVEQKTHYYSEAKRFDIKIECTSGNIKTNGTMSGTIVNNDGTIETTGDCNPTMPYTSVFLSDAFTLSGSQFANLYSLKFITLPKNATDTWLNMANLYNRIVIVPKSVTTLRAVGGINKMIAPRHINNVYDIMTDDAYLIIPQNNSAALQPALIIGANTLRRLDIPDTYTSIADTVFRTVNNIQEYHLYATTPPTLANVNAFPVNAGTKIYVPSASLTAYQTASVWSGLASYMVGE